MHLPKMFTSHVRKNKLLLPGQRVLVAWSGGADSTALLHLLLQKRESLKLAEVAVAHLNHKLRQESYAERELLVSESIRLGIEMYSDARDVVRNGRESLEAAARRVRYGFLAEAVEALACDVVVTAHHMDDQAETVLYGLLRGTHPLNIRRIRESITMKGVPFVRPLLPFRRNDLRQWLKSRDIGWVEDQTNISSNDRALIRNRIIPFITTILHRDPTGPLSRLSSESYSPVADGTQDSAF